ncbi:MAG: hypothetical protein U1G07_01285 [Verrucomicrobiota bacterium]
MLRRLLICLLAAPTLAAAGASRLEQCATIPLPGVEGALDHFTIDPRSQRLFLAARENNTVEIIGLREGRRLQSISGMKRPSGVAYLPRLNWICVANNEDGTLRLYDAANYQPKQIIPGLELADNVRYDSETDRVYVGFGRGALAIVDATQAQVAGMIKLAGHPEAFEVRGTNFTSFVNVPDAKQIAVVDLTSRQVSKTWPMDRFQANFPMAVDPAGQRLFVACRRPARLLALDWTSGKPIADVEISGDADDLFLDRARQRLYISCGTGVIDVLEPSGESAYQVVERIPTAPGARTSFFSADIGLLALAVPRAGQRDAEVRVYQAQAKR